MKVLIPILAILFVGCSTLQEPTKSPDVGGPAKEIQDEATTIQKDTSDIKEKSDRIAASLQEEDEFDLIPDLNKNIAEKAGNAHNSAVRINDKAVRIAELQEDVDDIAGETLKLQDEVEEYKKGMERRKQWWWMMLTVAGIIVAASGVLVWYLTGSRRAAAATAASGGLLAAIAGMWAEYAWLITAILLVVLIAGGAYLLYKVITEWHELNDEPDETQKTKPDSQ